MPDGIEMGMHVRLTFTDGKTRVNFEARFVRLLPMWISIGGVREDACIVLLNETEIQVCAESVTMLLH